MVEGQGDGQGLFQTLDTVKRQAAAVLEQGDHGRGGFVVFVLAHPGRGVGGKHRPAQPAAQPLQLIDLRLQGRHAGDAHQDRGLLALDVDPSATVGFGTGVAVREGGMGERDARGAGVVLGAVAPVALARLLGRGVPAGRGLARTARVGSSVARGVALWTVFPQDRVGALTARPEDQAAHPLQGRGLGLQLLGQARQGVHRRLEGGVIVLAERRAAGLFDDGIQALDRHLYPPGRLGLAWLAPAHASTPRRRRKSGCSGSPSTCLRERLGRRFGASLPRPAVRPSSCQLAAR